MFLTELEYRKVGEIEHELVKPLLYATKIIPKAIKVKQPSFLLAVPLGFLTDGASIPSFAWSCVGGPFSGRYVKPAILHDFLYAVHLYSRRQSDLIFLEALKVCGVSRLKRQLMFHAVRFGGSCAYKKGSSNGEV